MKRLNPLPPPILVVSLLSVYMPFFAKTGLLGANKEKRMRQEADILGNRKPLLFTNQKPLLLFKKSGATDRIRTGDPWYHKPVL